MTLSGAVTVIKLWVQIFR